MDVLINQGKCIFHECKVQISLHSFTSCGHLFCADGFIKLKFLCQKWTVHLFGGATGNVYTAYACLLEPQDIMWQTHCTVSHVRWKHLAVVQLVRKLLCYHRSPPLARTVSHIQQCTVTVQRGWKCCMPGDERSTCKILVKNNNLPFPMTLLFLTDILSVMERVWCRDRTWPAQCKAYCSGTSV